uniref:subtilisin n=1 Tax=Corethron hystrix TaxID=216773 RepID=A0A7S1FXM9_9STRA
MDDDIDSHGHGTHVAGTIVGKICDYDDDGGCAPSNGINADGVAPEAKVAVFDAYGTSKSFNAGDRYFLLETGRLANAYIHNASWGCKHCNYYTSNNIVEDRYHIENENYLLIMAGGNRGSNMRPKSVINNAKNVLTVCATNNSGYHAIGKRGKNYVAYFSGKGPSGDGRIKPDVCAPGHHVRSAGIGSGPTSRNCNSILSQGTSMAAPGAAGAALLIRQYFIEGWYPSGSKVPSDGFVPSGTLLKAVLVNSGQALLGTDNVYFVSVSSPYDTAQGFGRISLIHSLYLHGKSDAKLYVSDRVEMRSTSAPKEVSFILGECGAKHFSASLVYADKENASNSCLTCLVNRLDLTVEYNNTLYFPNGKDGPDEKNNVQRIRLEHEEGDIVTVRVSVANLVTEVQKYSLVVSGCFVDPTNVPSESPSKSSDPSESPSKSPAPSVSKSPSYLPSNWPSKIPTDMPSISPSLNPSITNVPSIAPSSRPSNDPSYAPSTLSPTESPSASPSLLPTTFPSVVPSTTSRPSVIPSSLPSISPSNNPSNSPSLLPSNLPSDFPTKVPSFVPSFAPSSSPSSGPSVSPSSFPTTSLTTTNPTVLPSFLPSDKPSFLPTNTPSLAPSNIPTNSTSSGPSGAPSFSPNTSPPSKNPTDSPSLLPSNLPSDFPTKVPSFVPSFAPSSSPSSGPSVSPSSFPTTSLTTTNPTVLPSFLPSDKPSFLPTNTPSLAPSNIPTNSPSSGPSEEPSFPPTNSPPSKNPTDSPSLLPSYLPSTFLISCSTKKDCKNLDSCMKHKCINRKCVSEKIKKCCLSDSDCDNEIACTIGICNTETRRCEFQNNCNDGNKCTKDICKKKMASVSSREKKGANARKKTIVAQKVSSVAVENARETTSVLE